MSALLSAYKNDQNQFFWNLIFLYCTLFGQSVSIKILITSIHVDFCERHPLTETSRNLVASWSVNEVAMALDGFGNALCIAAMCDRIEMIIPSQTELCR